MVKQKAENALCHILRHTVSGSTDGIGVFIARNIVLTARHVVESNKSLVISNTKQQSTDAVSRIIYPEDENIDAALVVLDDAIGRATCKMSKIIKSNNNIRGQLVTYFNGQKKSHPIELCSRFVSAVGNSQFVSNACVQPGYSGSPIVDVRGKVFSVVTHSTSMDAGPKKYTFWGVQPEKLHEFILHAKKEMPSINL